MSHQQIRLRKPRTKQESATGNSQESMNSRRTNGRTIFQKGRNMEYKTLGNTGLLVSRLCLGTMTFGPGQGIYKAIGAVDQKGADALVKAAIDGGINFFDTADVYYLRVPTSSVNGESNEFSIQPLRGRGDLRILQSTHKGRRKIVNQPSCPTRRILIDHQPNRNI